MAEAVIPVRHLEDITECPICQDVYTDPRSLPCIHTFCLECISKWARNKLPKNAVECPLCRKEFTIPDKGIGDLPKNIFIGKILTIKSSTVKEKGILCEWCQADTVSPVTNELATVRCIDCQENLCNACKNAHAKNKASRNHLVVVIGEKSDEDFIRRLPSRCDEHPDKDLEIYCFDCQETLCLMCFLTLHPGHKSGDIKKVAVDFRSRMKGNITTLYKDVQQQSDLVNELQESRRQVVEEFGKIERQIIDKADQLTEIIERHRQQLLSECKQQRDEQLSAVDYKIAAITQNRAMIESLMKYCDELLKKGSNSDIARETRSIDARVKEMEHLLQNKSVDVEYYAPKFLPADAFSDSKNWIGNVSSHPVIASKLRPSLTYCITEAGVVSLTSANNELFVTRYEKRDNNQIEVYDTSTFQQKSRITVPGAAGILYGLAACIKNNCLYVADNDQSTIQKVSLSWKLSSITTAKWKLAMHPYGLSINRLHNLLVASMRCVQEYTPSGSLVREIQVRGEPWQAVELSDGTLAVSLSLSSNVCRISVDSRVLRSYRYIRTGIAGGGRGLAVDKQGFILVTDVSNDRIYLLNPTLTEARLLPLPVDASKQVLTPHALWLDDSRGRLYVGELGGRNRVLVFDNIHSLGEAFTSFSR